MNRILPGWTPTHALSWLRHDDQGAEYAELSLSAGRLSAWSTAIGTRPVPYCMDLELETGDDFVTSRLAIETRGLGWRRTLELRRSESGAWSTDADLDLSQFDGALDPDVEWCPILNSLPTLRHRLLEGGSAPELTMVWVELPSLALHRSVQRYSYVGEDGAGNHVVRFDSGDFVEDITFDRDGIVIDYPGIARRIG